MSLTPKLRTYVASVPLFACFNNILSFIYIDNNNIYYYQQILSTLYVHITSPTPHIHTYTPTHTQNTHTHTHVYISVLFNYLL